MHSMAPEDDDINFSRATEPLQHLIRASANPRQFFLERIGERVLAIVAAADTENLSIRAARMAFEAPAFRYLEDWEPLDDERLSAFSEWSARLTESVSTLPGIVSRVRGKDYWLDVYLCRAEMVTWAELAELRGVAALLVGGWALPAVAPPYLGTPMHSLLRVAASKSGDVLHLAAQLEYLGQRLVTPLDGGESGYDRELFLKADERLEVNGQSLISLPISAQQGFFLACLTLVEHGDSAFLASLQRCPDADDNGLLKAITSYLLEGPIRLTGPEQRELRELLGLDEDSVGIVSDRIAHLPRSKNPDTTL